MPHKRLIVVLAVALVIAAVLAAVALGSQPSTTAPSVDHYAGTWQREGEQGAARLVLQQSSDAYRLYFLGGEARRQDANVPGGQVAVGAAVEGWTPLHWEGDALVGSPHVIAPLPVNIEVSLVYDEDTQRLLYSDNAKLHVSYTKVGDDTTAPLAGP
jgi:hypothetical protein